MTVSTSRFTMVSRWRSLKDFKEGCRAECLNPFSCAKWLDTLIFRNFSKIGSHNHVGQTERVGQKAVVGFRLRSRLVNVRVRKTREIRMAGYVWRCVHCDHWKRVGWMPTRSDVRPSCSTRRAREMALRPPQSLWSPSAACARKARLCPESRGYLRLQAQVIW